MFINGITIILQLRCRLCQVVTFPGNKRQGTVTRVGNGVNERRHLIRARAINLNDVQHGPSTQRQLLRVNASRVSAFCLVRTNNCLPNDDLRVTSTITTRSCFSEMTNVIMVRLLRTSMTVQRMIKMTINVSIRCLFNNAIVCYVRSRLNGVKASGLQDMNNVRAKQALSSGHNCHHCLQITLRSIDRQVYCLYDSVNYNSIEGVRLGNGLISLNGERRSLQGVRRSSNASTCRRRTRSRNSTEANRAILWRPYMARLRVVRQLLPNIKNELATSTLVGRPVLWVEYGRRQGHRQSTRSSRRYPERQLSRVTRIAVRNGRRQRRNRQGT